MSHYSKGPTKLVDFFVGAFELPEIREPDDICCITKKCLVLITCKKTRLPGRKGEKRGKGEKREKRRKAGEREREKGGGGGGGLTHVR